MKLTSKRSNDQNYLEYWELLVATPFICDSVEKKTPVEKWSPYISDGKKFLFSRDDRGLIYTDGSTMQVDATDLRLRFLNVQYVEVLEAFYVGVDG